MIATNENRRVQPAVGKTENTDPNVTPAARNPQHHVPAAGPDLRLHPLCTLFPRMSGAEFEALKADVKANGLRHPIVIHKGQILDGGNRHAACKAVGVKPDSVEYTGADPAAYVLSVNLHRRHMTAGQQAAIVAGAADWSQVQTVGRPKQSGNLAGLQTVAERSAQSGASERTQRMADQVVRASPELAQQVAHGEKTLPAAVRQLTGKRLGPRAVPVPEIEYDGPTAGEIMDQQQAEVLALQAQIDALTASDQAKELRKQMQLRDLAVREKDQEMDKNARLLRRVNEAERFRTQVVEISGQRAPRAALLWLKSLTKAAA